MTALLDGDDTTTEWLRAFVSLHGARTNDLDTRYEALRRYALERARHLGDRRAEMRLDGLRELSDLLTDGPRQPIVSRLVSAAAAAGAIGEWYTAFNALQLPAVSLSAVGRVVESGALIDGLDHSRALLIQSGCDVMVGTYSSAAERVRCAVAAIDRGDANSGDAGLVQFRLGGLVLSTGWHHLLAEMPPDHRALHGIPVDDLPASFRTTRLLADALTHLVEGDLDEARRRMADTTLEMFAAVRGRSYLPQLDLALDDPVAARTDALELRARCEGIDAPFIDAVVDLVLGECAWPDDLDEALACAHRSLVRAADYGLWPSAVDSLEAIGAMMIAGGRVRDGARLLAAAQVGRDAMGYVYRFAHRARYVAEATAIAGDDDGWREGSGLTLPDAVDLARRMRGERVRSTVGWGSLTPTEIAVVEQVTAGLTNPQIAERLLMGRATVKTHLLHVFAKLGVSSRAELVAAAIRREQNDDGR
jgi:DNA-binding CsgD family transcriptional regulator